MEEKLLEQTPLTSQEISELPGVEFPQEEKKFKLLSKLASKKLLMIASAVVGFLIVITLVLFYWLNAQAYRAKLYQGKITPTPSGVEEAQKEEIEELQEIESIDLGNIDSELKEIEENVEKL